MLKLSRELTEALQAVYTAGVRGELQRPTDGICDQPEIQVLGAFELKDAARFLFGHAGHFVPAPGRPGSDLASAVDAYWDRGLPKWRGHYGENRVAILRMLVTIGRRPEAVGDVLYAVWRLKEQGPRDASRGICADVCEFGARSVLTGAMVHLRGDGEFPVRPAPNSNRDERKAAYYSLDKWDRSTPYGADRWRLLGELIAYFERIAA